MTFYFVSPFEVDLTDYLSIYTAAAASEFEINVADYEHQLKSEWLPKWPKMIVGGPDAMSVLVWQLFHDPENDFSGMGSLLSRDHKTICLDIFHPEFILWHRSIIPERYRLVLYVDTSERFLELTSSTSHDQLMDWFVTLHDE